jgi:hypothetical protein
MCKNPIEKLAGHTEVGGLLQTLGAIWVPSVGQGKGDVFPGNMA